MALSKTVHPHDRTRFVRLSLVILEELTPLMQDILQNEILPSQIFNQVKRHKSLFQKLQAEQITLIHNAQNDGYGGFDIILTYTLLRNLKCMKFAAPTQGWGTSRMPGNGETTLGDDIERIRLIRNKVYGYATMPSMSEKEFQEYWSSILDICKRMQTLLGKNYVQSLQRAEVRAIDTDIESTYLEKIKNLSTAEKSTRELLREVIQDRAPCVEETVKIEARNPRKSFAKALSDTSISILNDLKNSITETTSESEIELMYELIEEYIRESKEEASMLASNSFLDELERKIKKYAYLKTNRMQILSRYIGFILRLRKKYGADVQTSRDSKLHLPMTEEQPASSQTPAGTSGELPDIWSDVGTTIDVDKMLPDEKENILRDFHAWLKDSYENIRVMRLYIGKPDCGQYTFTAIQEVIVLVIDGFNPIEEVTYQHRKNTFPIICKLWKFLPKNDVSTIADVEPLSSSTMLSKVEKQIQSISKVLFQRHSNLEIVSASDYRLKDIGEEKEQEICIVLYCSCKGFVPLHETAFPKEIDGIKTDVREGFFHLFGNDNFFKRSTDLLNPLMMGASIGKKDDNNGGTLGGFVTLNNGDIGFITCAHVLFDLSSRGDTSAHFDVVQPYYGYMNTNEVCGIHEKSCFPSHSNTSNCTIDAALVKLTNRFPERGLFAELTVDNLKENGYSIENLPEYSTGDVRDCDEAARRMLPCVKWGAKTGFTRGMLRLEGTAVRWTTDSINLGNPPSQISCIYNKQLEIQGIGGTSFALPGDSGALVFQIDPAKEKGEEHQLHCIGMIVGGTSAGKTIVTPIKPILEALNVKMHKFSLNKMDES